MHAISAYHGSHPHSLPHGNLRHLVKTYRRVNVALRIDLLVDVDHLGDAADRVMGAYL